MPYRNDDFPSPESTAHPGFQPKSTSVSPALQPMVQPAGPTIVIPATPDPAELRELYRIRELLTDHWPAFQALIHELSWRQFQIGASGLPGWSDDKLADVTRVRELYLQLRPFFYQLD